MSTSAGYEIGNPTKLRAKPTYNIGDYGHDLSLPLLLAQASNVQTLTPSTASFHQTEHDSALPIDEVLSFISESDKCEQLHAGNDTDFDKTWLIQPDMSFFSYKIALNMGIGLKVSAYTSGNITVDNVHLTITRLRFQKLLISKFTQIFESIWAFQLLPTRKVARAYVRLVTVFFA